MRYLIILVFCFLIQSCATRRDILYLQNSETYPETAVRYVYNTLQPNDVLQITVSALIPDSATPYNFQTVTAGAVSGASSGAGVVSGYVVREDYTINFPILGFLSVKGKTLFDLEADLTETLQVGGHLKSPSVQVQLINSKFTVLGEVGSPGSISFTEQNLNIFQAIGLAGDLTPNGKRNDILLMREVDGKRIITHLDIRTTAIIESPYYYIKPNDVIIVNPNGPEIKKSGYVANLGALFGLVSFALTMVLIIKN